MIRLMAVDPGVTGAWAVLEDGDLMAAGELPVAGDGTQRMVSAPLFRDIVESYMPTFVMMERVGARPGEAPSFAFKFGRSVGTIEGVIGSAGVPVRYVTPQVWKKHFGLTGGTKNKEQSRQRALETWPAHSKTFARKLDHGRAEAALIGLWAFKAAVAAGEDA